MTGSRTRTQTARQGLPSFPEIFQKIHPSMLDSFVLLCYCIIYLVQYNSFVRFAVKLLTRAFIRSILTVLIQIIQFSNQTEGA